MRVRVLGPIEVETSRGEAVVLSGGKMRGLAAVLALEAASPIPPQRLIDALWGDQEVLGLNTLQVTMSKLRRALAEAGEADRIVTVPSGYQLDVAREDVDALAFEAHLEVAGRTEDGPELLAERLTRALALWRGPALADAPTTALTDAVRARLDERRQVAIEDLVDTELALGRHRRLASELESLVAAEPLRERRWGQLMRALYGAGQQAEALRAFQRARDVLIESMGVEPGPELRALEAAVLAQDDIALGAPPAAGAAPARSAAVGGGFKRRGNVRHPVGSCIGREDDLDRLAALAARNRLVTLTGTGGVGKSRLALELAVRLLPEVSDGVWWVDLAAARDDADVIAALQRALQLDASGADVAEALDDLTAVLGDRSALFVLDNCEQLIGSVEPIIEELLGTCPGVRIVATSRMALDVGGEVLFTVHPLGIDDAVALFEQRIEGLGADLGEAGGSVAQICERVDRLPLALELAAARVRHLSLDEILDRLTDRFELLRGRGGAKSHQSDLRAVADWSYDLLDESEQVVFERLSVFAAGATIDAASIVCSGDTVEAGGVEPMLDRLVDKSLVYVDRSGHQSRYRMLQTLYDYAGDRLAERGTENQTRRAHAAWVRALADSVDFGARTTGPTIAAVQVEDVAVRDAIAWAIGADAPLALDICTKLGPFWFGTMRVSTGWDLLSTALDAAGDADASLRASGLVWAVVFSTMVHDVETADRLAEEAWAFEQRIAEPERLGRISFARALAAAYRAGGDSTPWVEAARQHFTAAGSAIGLGHLDFADGAARLVAGDLDGAAEGLGAAAEAFRQEKDHLGLILAVSRLGELAWRRQDIDAYAERHAELLRLGQEGRSPGVITGATARLAHARLVQGRIDEAEALASEAVASAGESFMSVINGYTFKSAGLVNLALGHVEEGRAQLQIAIEAFSRGTGDLGRGLAAMCWIDLSRSFSETGDAVSARDAGDRAMEMATAAGDPWVVAQAESLH